MKLYLEKRKSFLLFLRNKMQQLTTFNLFQNNQFHYFAMENVANKLISKFRQLSR